MDNNQSLNSGPIGLEDTYDLLKETPEEEPKGGEEKPKEDKRGKTEEIAIEDDEPKIEELETELEEEEPKPEDLELVTPVRRKEILAKYPKIFKDFPYLEKAYYRDREYTELLPTIDDAKQAIERANTLSEFESQLVAGNTEGILKTVKEADPAAYGKIVDNYLQTLAQVDQGAYYHVIGTVGKNMIVSMAKEGARLNNEHLKNAALVLNQFMFGKSEFDPITPFSKPNAVEDPAKRDLQTRQEAFVRDQLETVQNDLSTKANNVLQSTIDLHIDPKGVMSDYVKRNATRDALNDLNELISKDTYFRRVLDKLWQKAAENNFSSASKEEIRRAYLSKAKTLLPAVISKSRNQALKGYGKATDDNEPAKDRRGPITPGKSASPSNSGKTKEVPKGMKTLDFLNQD